MKIEFTGTRRGEKLLEELFYDPNHVDTPSHEKIFLSRLDEENGGLIDEVRAVLDSGMRDEELRRAIFSLAGTSDYRPE